MFRPSNNSSAPSSTPDWINSKILFFDCGEITGPKSVPGTCPGISRKLKSISWTKFTLMIVTSRRRQIQQHYFATSRYCNICGTSPSHQLQHLNVAKLASAHFRLPAFTFSCSARDFSSGSHSLASPTKIAVLSAIHLWPAAPKAAPTNWFKVLDLLASATMTPWFLAPILLCTRLPFLAPLS